MENFINAVLNDSLDFCYWLVGFFIVFGVLAKLMPCNPEQPIIRKGMLTDLAYGFIIPILSRFANFFLISVGFGIVFYGTAPEQLTEYFLHGHGYLSTLPLWLQAAVVRVAAIVPIISGFIFCSHYMKISAMIALIDSLYMYFFCIPKLFLEF